MALLAGGGLGVASGAVGVRKNARDLTNAEWKAFERGVEAMKLMPVSAAVSWRFQANIHGHPPDEPAPHYQGWATRRHGNRWFPLWHRAYLLYFERIVRAFSGDPGFMLPYWDWTDPTQRSLPARFLDPASPLYERDREATINAGSPIDLGTFAWPVVAGIHASSASAPGMNADHGAIESKCRDFVHDSIGGLMGDPDTAARDPIFWLHHANVDRLWSAWLRAGGESPLPGETPWLDTPFWFYGPRGVGGYVYPSQLLNTEQLGYRYQDYPRMPIMAAGFARRQLRPRKPSNWLGQYPLLRLSWDAIFSKVRDSPQRAGGWPGQSEAERNVPRVEGRRFRGTPAWRPVLPWPATRPRLGC